MSVSEDLSAAKREEHESKASRAESAIAGRSTRMAGNGSGGPQTIRCALVFSTKGFPDKRFEKIFPLARWSDRLSRKLTCSRTFNGSGLDPLKHSAHSLCLSLRALLF